MNKINYNIDLDSLTLEEFSEFMEYIDELAYEDGQTKEEIIDNQDLNSERYYIKACERYHYHNLKIGRTLRSVTDLDLYEVTDEGQVNFIKHYKDRNYLTRDLNFVYNLDSAFVFSPSKSLGYVIHGDVSKCTDYLTTLIFLYKEKALSVE